MKTGNKFNLSLPFLVFLLLVFMPLAPLAQSRPSLKNITCAKWLTYEEDMAHELAHFFNEEGSASGKTYLEIAKSQARNQKIGYLTSLIDIYATSSDAKYRDYEKELIVYCSKPQHADSRVRDAFINVHYRR